MWYVLAPLGLVISNKLGSLSQTLDNEVVAFSPAVDIPDVVCGGLEVAGGVVALGYEDVVVDTAL